jgi:hypothetical protein
MNPPARQPVIKLPALAAFICLAMREGVWSAAGSSATEMGLLLTHTLLESLLCHFVISINAAM